METKQKEKLLIQFKDNGDTNINPNVSLNCKGNVGPTFTSKIGETTKIFKEYLGNSYTDPIYLKPIKKVEVEKELIKP